MRRWLRSSLAALALGALGAMVPAGPAGPAEVPDETLLDAEAAKPWRAVGRVNIGGVSSRGMCTGTLIAPDLVLTAAHCLTQHGTGELHPPGTVHFVTGWYQGKGTGHSLAEAVVLHPGWDGPGRGILALETDIGLIRLRTPLPPSAADPIEIDRPPLPGDALTLISYRRDRPHALTHQPDCPYRAIVGRVLEIGCPVTSGASGGAVIDFVDGQPRLVAVLAAMGTRREESVAYAVRADRVVDELRALLP